MIPKRLYIKNAIGIKKGLNREEIEIDFTKFPSGIIGIVGDTGVGKSVIVEMCTPYLKLITRSGSIQSHFYGNDALKEFEFEFNDKTYLSRFIIDATKNKIKPYLYEIVDGKEIVLNDKISNYNLIVSELFGDFDTFVHSVFAPQGEFPIISLTDSELKKLFIDLFNLDKYKDIYLPYVKEKYTEIDNEIRVEKMMIEKYDEEIRQEDDIKKNLVVLKKEVKQNEDGLVIAENEKSAILDELKAEEKKLDEYRHLIELKQSYLNQKENIIKQIEEFDRSNNRQFKNIEANLATSKRFRDEVKERLASEEKRFVRFRRIIDNSELITKKRNEIVSLREEIKKINDLIKEQQEINNNIVLTEHTIRTYKDKVNALESEIESLKKQTSVIEEVPCAGTEINSQCKLLFNAYKYKDTIQEKENEINKIKKYINDENVKLKKLKDKVFNGYENKLNDLENKLQTLESEKWEQLFDEIEIAEKEYSQFETLKKELNEKIERSIESDIELKNRIEELKASVAKKRSALEKQLEDVVDNINKIKINDPDLIKKKISELNFELVNLDGKIKSTNLKIVDLKSQIKVFEDSLDKIEKRKKEKDEIINRIKNYLDLFETYKVVEKFLKEIPVIEINALSNSLKEYTNELLLGLFDYSLTVDFITEMAKAGGRGTKEVFKVLVYNNGDEVLGKNLSGGQKQIVDMAIRMAIETLFYNVSSKRFKTVFMDESDSGLDTERAIKFWDMVELTHNRNNRYYTFIITHRTEIKNNLDQVIDLNKWRI